VHRIFTDLAHPWVRRATTATSSCASCKGIHFQADPAFKGVRREVVAQDFVYPLQRIADPATRSPLWGWIESQGFVGLAEARKAALDSKQPFDYDRADRGRDRRGPLHHPLHAQGGAPALRRDHRQLRPAGAPRRARWWSTTATRSTRTRWAAARSGSSSGAAAR
jgi:hypothetical protein